LKKALALALTAFMVLALATAAFAVEVSYEGKVEVAWGSTEDDPGFKDENKEAKVTVDFTKDFGDGVTAGVKTKVEAHSDIYEDQDEGEEGHDEVDFEDLKKEFVFDGEGWIQVERDLFTVKASTGIDDQVGRDLKENTIKKAAGLGVTLNLIDGLTVNTVFNAGNPEYNYVIKGEYANDLFTLGGGFQSSEGTKQAFGVYGTLNLIDGLTIDAEYNNRDEDNKVDDNEKNAIFATASYTLDALTAKAGLLVQDGYFKSISADDVDNEDWRINEAWRADKDFEKRFSNADKATILFADLSYDLTDALSVNGYLDYLISAKDESDNEVKDLDEISYKVGVAYTIDALKLEGWYRAYGDSQVGGKATYGLADGVDASFEVGYKMFEKEGKDGEVSYTAKIVATL